MLKALALTALLLTAAPTLVDTAQASGCHLVSAPRVGTTWTTPCVLTGYDSGLVREYRIPSGSRVYVVSSGTRNRFMRLQVIYNGHTLIVYP